MTYEYGAMSSKYSLEADNKLTAYAAMIAHYGRHAPQENDEPLNLPDRDAGND